MRTERICRIEDDGTQTPMVLVPKKSMIDYRPRDLTHRCQGCGEWMTAQEAASHCRTGGRDAEGNPWPEACGPIDEVPRDDITIWLRDQDEAGCHEAADELDARRKRLSEMAEAGTGYSQQTVDALTKERDWLQQELTRHTAEITALDELDSKVRRLTAALTTIKRSGAPGAAIVAKRDDGHACGWCRGMLTPCPVETARKALEEK